MVLVVLDVVASATGESVVAVVVVAATVGMPVVATTTPDAAVTVAGGTEVAAAGVVGALLVSLFRVQFTQCTVSVQFLQVTV